MTVTVRKTVLIIGCGPAGLGAIEQFRRKDFDVVAYEARSSVGGLWNFDPNPPQCEVTFDQYGHAVALSNLEREGKPVPSPTPMYAGVTANTPRDIMPYRSHAYPQGTADYPTHKVIYQYQQRFAEQFTSHIHFNRVITRVRHAPELELEDQQPATAIKRWLVEWTPSYNSNSADIGKIFEEQFDHVVVANGTDSRPFIPYIDGLWDWKGQIVHSRWYRRPEDYAGKTVMVVGGGPSSADIVRELGMLKVHQSPLAPKKIYRSFRSKLRYDTEHEKGWSEFVQNISPMRIVRGPSTDSATGRIETLLDQVVDDVDVSQASASHSPPQTIYGLSVDSMSLTHYAKSQVIIFATGFVARFEFFKETDAPFATAPLLRYPTVSENARRPPSEAVGQTTLEGGHRVHNLDGHQIFYLPDPTLAFLLLHAEAIPWPFSEMQARAIAAFWSGTPLELKPHPEEERESHSVLILGHPGEFDYAERLLSLIGEGGEEEVDAEGKWGKWPAWKKHIRALID